MFGQVSTSFFLITNYLCYIAVRSGESSKRAFKTEMSEEELVLRECVARICLIETNDVF